MGHFMGGRRDHFQESYCFDLRCIALHYLASAITRLSAFLAVQIPNVAGEISLHLVFFCSVTLAGSTLFTQDAFVK